MYQAIFGIARQNNVARLVQYGARVIADVCDYSRRQAALVHHQEANRHIMARHQANLKMDQIITLVRCSQGQGEACPSSRRISNNNAEPKAVFGMLTDQYVVFLLQCHKEVIVNCRINHHRRVDRSNLRNKKRFLCRLQNNF